MWLFRLCLPIMVLLLAGCSGFSGFLVVSNGRLLLSVTVNPSFADPVNFPGAQVRFTATGNFNAEPAMEKSMANVIWTVDRPAFSEVRDPGHAVISPDGVATCSQGFIGIVHVFATAPANPGLPVSSTNRVTGTAQLRCP